MTHVAVNTFCGETITASNAPIRRASSQNALIRLEVAMPACAVLLNNYGWQSTEPRYTMIALTRLAL